MTLKPNMVTVLPLLSITSLITRHRQVVLNHPISPLTTYRSDGTWPSRWEWPERSGEAALAHPTSPGGSGHAPIVDLLRHGAFRRQAGFLALGQPLAADAAVNV
jgi:hypothetical protein